jgi:phosphoribosylformylglycinamidine synthase
MEEPELLDAYQVFVFPGGFSYGDDVAAGKILANQVIHHLSEALKKFVEDGKLVLGICNGFQVLVKSGILPGADVAESGDQLVTITDNDSGKFEDRWVWLEPDSSRCVFLEPGRRIYLPIAHAEGKIVTKDAPTLEQLKSGGYVAFRYVDKDGNAGKFPVNPNGSMDSIAGLTDSTGRVLGLMPHPERYIHHTQHPHWSRLADGNAPDGRTIFDNAVSYVQSNL